MFKSDWEGEQSRFNIDAQTIQRMVKAVFPDLIFSYHEIISIGCANLNIKIFLKNHTEPFMLRIYVRDITAAFREQKIAELIKKTVPVPKFYFVGDCNGYRYALIEYIHGVSLRDFLLNYPDEEKALVMYDVGRLVSEVSKYTFLQAGFFDQNLVIRRSAPIKDYIAFTQKCLQHFTVEQLLGAQKIKRILQFVKRYESLLPNELYKTLVHGDYDPSNILIRKIDGEWKVVAIVDWEFAFSGCYLWDVSSMLRYEHQMPSYFGKSFIQGMTDAGISLPKEWRKIIKVLNVISLLDLLVRHSPQDKPNQSADICKLLEHMFFYHE